jgi:hypothetical protein
VKFDFELLVRGQKSDVPPGYPDGQPQRVYSEGFGVARTISLEVGKLQLPKEKEVARLVLRAVMSTTRLTTIYTNIHSTASVMHSRD